MNPKAQGEEAVSAARRSEVAIRAFLRIMDAWKVRDEDARTLLGGVSRTTLHNWKAGQIPTLGKDVLERISYVLGIYKALQILLPKPESADAWIRKPNLHFHGQPALERMLGGNVVDLYEVRKYLDFARGNDF